MSMKRKVMGIMVASVMVTTAVAGSVNAAAPLKKSIVKPVVAVTKVAVNVNGENVLIRSIKVKQATLVSVKDFAEAVGADLSYNKGVIELSREDALVSLKVGSTKLTGSQGEDAFAVTPTVIGGSVYVQWKPIADGLNFEVADGKIFTYRLLSGIHTMPRFVNANTLVVAHENEDGSMTDYLVSADGKSNASLVTGEDASSIVISPNGMYGAYINSTGNMYVINLASKQVTRISADDKLKTDLSWSQDSTMVYFVYGDKSEALASITISNGTIKKYADDKVENKSELKVSADGKKFLYLVSKVGKVEGADKEETLKLDFSNALTQIVYLDTTQTKPAAVELTSSTDNKIYSNFLSDGRIAYISADVEGIIETASLKVVSLDKSVKDLVKDVDVLVSTSTNDGTLYIAAADHSEKIAIYMVNTTTGALTKIVDIDNISELAISNDGKSFAINMNDKIAVINNGQVVNITK